MTTATDNQVVGVRLSIEAAIGKLSETMGKVSDTMDRLHKFMAPNPRSNPIVRPIQGAAVSDGSTYFALDMGGPTSGRLWDVRRVATWPGGSTDPFAALSGVTVALVKIQGGNISNKGSATAPPFFDLALAPAGVPNDADFGVHELQIRPGEHLALLYKGTSNGQNLMGSGQVEEWLESTPELVTA